jgi:small-conductance mechanosensitive channel
VEYVKFPPTKPTEEAKTRLEICSKTIRIFISLRQIVAMSSVYLYTALKLQLNLIQIIILTCVTLFIYTFLQ